MIPTMFLFLPTIPCIILKQFGLGSLASFTVFHLLSQTDILLYQISIFGTGEVRWREVRAVGYFRRPYMPVKTDNTQIRGQAISENEKCMANYRF
jgi:hypothetical protein